MINYSPFLLPWFGLIRCMGLSLRWAFTRGGTAKMLMHASGVNVHLFDTFCGLPFDDSNGVHRKGEFAESLEEVTEFLGHKFVSHVGLVPDTIAQTMRFRFIHMDLDTYQSTAATLDCVAPKMVKGGIIVMDDWHWPSCAGVTKAIEERFGSSQLTELTEHQVKIQF
jgi:O-methyltransferase